MLRTTKITIDTEVIERAREGDREAADAIVAALARPLYNLALRMVLSPADAEDATQEALIKIIARLASFEGRSSFSTWAWSVASRTYLDYRRGQYRDPSISFDAFERDLADGLDLAAEDDAEQRILVAQVKVGCARALLHCLDGDHRLAFVLGEIMAMSGPEAAAITDVSEAVFRKRLSRARQRLYDALRSHCGIIEPRASCRCHRRLRRATELGRVDATAPDLGIDVGRLHEYVRQLNDLAERGAAYYQADVEFEPSPGLRERIQQMSQAALG